MKVKISDIAILNKSNMNNNNRFKEIKYLDTGSIFEGRVIEYKKIKIGEDKIPSRAKRLVSDNTIVYSSVRPRLCHYGILDKTSKNTVVSTDFVTIDAICNKVNPYYLYYKLIQNEVTEYLAAIADTAVSAYQSITPSDLANLEIDIIENINDQEKIAMLFKCIDIKIQNNNKINSELESMAKTIYDYWFLQFEFPNEEGKPYKSSGGKMVWNEELGREIPEGWDVKKIKDIAEIYQPQTISESKFIANGKYDVYGANGVVGKYNKYNHENNEIAVCCRGASCGRYLMTQPYSWITGNAMVITPNSFISKEYIYYGLSYKKISKYITGSAQPQITRTNLENMTILIPTKFINNKYDLLASKLRKKSQEIYRENKHLSSLRDFLLPLLMNGQVGFKENISAKEIEIDRKDIVASVNR